MHNRMILRSASMEMRSGTTDTAPGQTLEGYAVVYNQDTEINSWEGKFTERISKGAFAESLKRRQPVVQFDHGRDSRVGSVPIGKIEELREDNKGLFIRASLFDNPTVEPVRQAIEAQAISGMSFKFRVTRDEWTNDKGRKLSTAEVERALRNGDPLRRNIKAVDLAELGPVVFPAYAGTSVGVRSGKTDNPPELLKMRLALMNWN